MGIRLGFVEDLGRRGAIFKGDRFYVNFYVLVAFWIEWVLRSFMSVCDEELWLGGVCSMGGLNCLFASIWVSAKGISQVNEDLVSMIKEVVTCKSL